MSYRVYAPTLATLLLIGSCTNHHRRYGSGSTNQHPGYGSNTHYGSWSQTAKRHRWRFPKLIYAFFLE